jgi:hypothetical protein
LIRPKALANSIRLPAFALLGAMALAGCHRKPAAVAPPPPPPVAQTPIALETPPATGAPPMIAPAPAPATPPPTAVAIKPKRTRAKKAAPPPTPPPVVASAASAPAATAIGALSSGRDATPRSLQEAKDLIAAIEKQIGALPAKTASDQKSGLRKVRRFVQQAQQAVASGDSDGAKTLATKAKLLLDDLEK